MIARQLRRKKIGMNPLQKRKAVSPVIATVILVAVAITVAVGVSYWMGGISSQYTQFEKVEIQTGYATVISGGWNVTLQLKNSGSATATLTHAFVNEVPVDGYNATVLTADERLILSPEVKLISPVEVVVKLTLPVVADIVAPLTPVFSVNAAPVESMVDAVNVPETVRSVNEALENAREPSIKTVSPFKLNVPPLTSIV